jgi:hypothetical protein
MSEAPQYSYVTDKGTYDVTLLNNEGQELFKLLAIANNRVTEASQDLGIAQASVIAINNKLQEALTDEALISEKDDETTDEE